MSQDLQHAELQLNPRFRFQWEEAQQSFVLLYPEGLIKLSGSAAEIIRRCVEKTTFTQLITDLRQTFPDAEGLEDDVREFLQDAREQDWIIISS